MSKITEYHFDTIMSMCGECIALVNAFSINMLNGSETLARFTKVDLDDARRLVSRGFNSHIGHADMAAVVGTLLEKEVPMVRDSAKFCGVMLVAQYSGPRLAEGATTLPEGAEIVFWLVEDQSWYN